MTRIGRKLGEATRSLGFKMLVALAAAALPALAVAAVLGMALVTDVGRAERDFNNANLAAYELTEMLVVIEKEHGLVGRLPGELDLVRLDGYAQKLADAGQQFETELAELAAIEGIVSPDIVSEIRATRRQMKRTIAAIVEATKSFAQATALELVAGPYEESTLVLRTFLNAITSNVDGVVEHARGELRASSLRAWRLTPVALIGALCAAALGVWMTRRNFVLPVTRLTGHVVRIRESGNLDVPLDSVGGNDEIGTLTRSFNLMIADLAGARRRLIASETETRTQYERLNAAINNMPQGLCMFDARQRLIISNSRYSELYGLQPTQSAAGTPLRAILEHRVANSTSPEFDADYIENQVIERKPLYFVNELENGHVIAVSYQPMLDGGSIATHEDITERRKTRARIVYMARHDALTGLPNRVRFREEMIGALGRLERGEPLAVLSLDLDGFKAVNDTLGHPIGDLLLQAVAGRLRACVRATDIVARLGGDEFAILQGVADQPVEFTAVAARLIQALAEPFDIEGHQIVIGASVGIAMAPDDGNDPDRLMKNADMALYRAKEDGRGVYRFFEPAMDARMQIRRALELDLRKALGRGEFELFYQPLIRLQTGALGGFEALLRWRHPERGLVPPTEFIPLTEEIGLIGPIATWVLKQACGEAAGWPGDIKVAVNLSPVQFKQGTVVRDVMEALDASGLSAHRLELEITEGVLLQDTEATVSTLTRLRELGVRISMDDFGTGYSSLGYLRRFPFDKIKIDRSFIHDLSDNPDSIAIVRAVTGLGNALGMGITAEGVETEDQLRQLRAEGCTEAQGCLFSAARPASELQSLLQRFNPVSEAVA
jgi:diguanylate cyclase (GGDEF)-like protein